MKKEIDKMLVFLLAILAFPVSPQAIENFLVVEGIRNYSVIPGIWYNSSFFISLKMRNISVAQQINVNVSFSFNQSNVNITFPKGNWVILNCIPKNNSCISKKEEVNFMFKTKNQSLYKIELIMHAKLLNYSQQAQQGFYPSQAFSDILLFFEELKGFLFQQQNKEIVTLLLIFLIGLALGIIIGKSRKKKIGK
ncbi:MAG: hypothetical protein ACP5FX_00560 [Candidatus Micrarchaeia archaeon]